MNKQFDVGDKFYYIELAFVHDVQDRVWYYIIEHIYHKVDANTLSLVCFLSEKMLKSVWRN